METKEHTVTCPSNPEPDSDIVGCGTTFTQAPDAEGWYDCPHCGIFFRTDESLPLNAPPPPPAATVDGALRACINYVTLGYGDFRGIPPDLVCTFTQRVDTLMEARHAG